MCLTYLLPESINTFIINTHNHKKPVYSKKSGPHDFTIRHANHILPTWEDKNPIFDFQKHEEEMNRQAEKLYLESVDDNGLHFLNNHHVGRDYDYINGILPGVHRVGSSYKIKINFLVMILCMGIKFIFL